jgi:D-glycero-alpha-D-manno-heptose-7-phosphate kinase
MIIARTPFRISFFGGGTDYPAWYREEGGAVFSTTINKYCYVMCRAYPAFFNIKHRIIWSRIENVQSVTEIENPAVRGAMQMLGFGDDVGLEIHYHGDLPARSGMGSSSAFAAGLIKCLHGLRGHLIGPHELALETIRLEQDVLKEAVGSQDQVAVAHGGLNHIRFHQSGDISVEPVPLAAERLRLLEDNLMLFYTGRSRFASVVAAKVIENIQVRKSTTVLRDMAALVPEALSIVASGADIDQFGHLLHTGWLLKRELSNNVSNTTIDDLYATARAHGALGGKLLGAGESGFMLFYVRPEDQPRVLEAFKDVLHVPFRFSFNGTSIIHSSPDENPVPATMLDSI